MTSPDRTPSPPFTSVSKLLTRRVLLLSLIGAVGICVTMALIIIAELGGARNHLDQMNAEAASTFDLFFLDIQTDMIATGDSLAPRGDITLDLLLMRARNHAYLDVLFVDQDGNILSQHSAPGRPRLTRADLQGWLSAPPEPGTVAVGPLHSEGPDTHVDMAVRARSATGGLAGLLVVRVDLDDLWDKVLEMKVGEAGYAYLADSSGSLVAYRNPRLAATSHRMSRSPQSIALANFSLYSGLDGQLVLASARPLKSMPWFAVIEQPVREALAPLVLLMLALLVLVLFLGFLLYNTISFTRSRIVMPLLALSDAVGKMTAGRLDQRFTASHNDELGQLAGAFNSLGEQLQQSFDALEERITELDRTQEALREAQQLYENIFRLSPEVIVLSREADGLYLAVNDAYERVTGYCQDEVVGRSVAEIGPWVSMAERQAVIDKIGETGRVSNVEVQFRRKSGELYTVLVSLTRVELSGERCLITIFSDITGRKQAEDELRRSEVTLRESEEKFRTMIEQAVEGYALLDEQGQVIAWNQSMERIWGMSRADVLGRLFCDIQYEVIVPERRTPERYDQIRAMLMEALNTGKSRLFGREIEAEVYQPSGKRVFIMQTIFPIKTARGFRIASMSIDITERKLADKKIQEQLAFDRLMTGVLTRLATSPWTEIDATVQNALQETAAFFGIERAYIYSTNPEDPRNWTAAYEWRAGHTRQIYSPDQKIPFGTMPWSEGQLMAGSIIRINSLDEYPLEAAPEKKGCQEEGIKSNLVIPITGLRGSISGCIGINARSRTVIWSDADVARLKMLGDAIAGALERKRAEGNRMQQIERLNALRAIDQAIITSEEQDRFLDLFLQQTRVQLRVDAAVIMLLDEPSQALYFAAGAGLRSDAFRHAKLPIGTGLAGQAALERRTIYFPDLRELKGNVRLSKAASSEEFVAYYGIPLIAKDKLRGVLEIFHRSALPDDHNWLTFMETLAGQAAIAVDNAALLSDLQKSNIELELAYDTTLEGWSRALDLRDQETEGHTRRVTVMTIKLAQALGLSSEAILHIKRGALLHDIGKMGIPDRVLLKPGKFNDEERAIMRKHPDYAYAMLSPIRYLKPALDIPYCHHEWWNGTGYPRGLKGEEIPLAARLFAVVDVWDALRSDRLYRAAWSKEETVQYIRSLIGVQFDPHIVEVFLEKVAE